VAVVTRRGAFKLADANPARGAGNASLYSPNRSNLDWNSALGRIGETATSAGEGILNLLEQLLDPQALLDLLDPQALLDLLDPEALAAMLDPAKLVELLSSVPTALFDLILSLLDPANAQLLLERIAGPLAEVLLGVVGGGTDPLGLLSIFGGNLGALFPGVDLATAITDPTSALTSWLNTGILPLGLLLGPQSALPAWNLFGLAPDTLFPLIPVSAIGDFIPNLLQNPTFETAASVFDPLSKWGWTGDRAHSTTGGSAEITPTGIREELLSDPATPATAGQTIDLTLFTAWEGLSRSGAEPIQMAVVAFDKLGQELATTVVDTITNPGANSLGSPGADAEGWVPLTGTYTVPTDLAGVALIRQTGVVTDQANPGGKVWFSDGAHAKTQLFDEAFTSGLPGNLDDLFAGVAGAAGDLLDLLDTLNPFGTGLPGILTRFANLGQAGTFAAPALAALETVGSPFIAIADLVTQGLINPSSTGNPLEMIRNNLGSLVDNVRQGADGSPSTGSIVTDLLNAFTGLRQGITANAVALTQIQEVLPTAASGGAATVTGATFTDDAERPAGDGYGPGWLTLGPSAPYGIHTDGHRWYWTDSGGAARTQIGIYTAGQTTSDYQSVKDVLSSVMESPQAWTGAGPSSTNWLIGRANVTGTRFVLAARFYNQVQLYDYNNGTYTLIPIPGGGNGYACTPTAGSRWELECGNGTSLRHFTLRQNGAVVGQWDDTGNITPLGAANRFGGQAHQSDARSGGEATPGSTDLWQISDKIPAAGGAIGSGARLYRTATTTFAIPSAAIFPTNVFQSVENKTADITADAVNGKFTVSQDGWYDLDWNIYFSGTSSAGGLTAIYKTPVGGAATLERYCFGWGYLGVSMGGHCSIYLRAGEAVQLGSNGSAPSGTGTASGTATWFSIALANRSSL
jgi:hypothetical protein